MADKTIGDLPAIKELTDDTLFPVEQRNTALRVSGEQMKAFFDISKFLTELSLLQLSVGDLSNLQTGSDINLVSAINWLKDRVLFSINGRQPDPGTNNAVVRADDITVQIPVIQFQGTLQQALDTLAELPSAYGDNDVTAEYMRWAIESNGAVPEFFLSDAIADPGSYIVYTDGTTWRMRYIHASGGSNQDWRWIEQYGDDMFTAAFKLYAGNACVISFYPDNGEYKVYEDSLATERYVKDRLASVGGSGEQDVTAAFEAWLAANGKDPESVQYNDRHEYLWTLPDGRYRVEIEDRVCYLWRVTKQPYVYRWVAEYTDDAGMCYVSLYANDKETFYLSTEETAVMVNGKSFATLEDVDRKIDEKLSGLIDGNEVRY